MDNDAAAGLVALRWATAALLHAYSIAEIQTVGALGLWWLCLAFNYAIIRALNEIRSKLDPVAVVDQP